MKDDQDEDPKKSRESNAEAIAAVGAIDAAVADMTPSTEAPGTVYKISKVVEVNVKVSTLII